ncbi:MAG: hypothetical protein H0U75_11400 [Legionella sp.]|nr:hypothetical protein [Legionella sp.]
MQKKDANVLCQYYKTKLESCTVLNDSIEPLQNHQNYKKKDAARAATDAIASANVLAVTSASARAAADAKKMVEAAQKTALVSASNTQTQYQEGLKLGVAMAPYVALSILQKKAFKKAADTLTAKYPGSIYLETPAIETQKGMLQGISTETMRTSGPILYRVDADEADYLQKTLADLSEGPLTTENFAKLLGCNSGLNWRPLPLLHIHKAPGCVFINQLQKQSQYN